MHLVQVCAELKDPYRHTANTDTFEFVLSYCSHSNLGMCQQDNARRPLQVIEICAHFPQ